MITKEQIQLLQQTTLASGINAWEYVQAKNTENQLWIAAAILQCMKRGYALDRLSVNWEARDLRYADAESEADGAFDTAPAVKFRKDDWKDDCSDIAAYLEGMPSMSYASADSRLAMHEESERLIAVARKTGGFIPHSEWDTYGCRIIRPSGESIVYFNEKDNRVIKFKDPFAYISLKDDRIYHILYEHHVHNHLFGDVGYRFLGISQDPVSGSVRLVFEQPFIDTLTRPAKGEIQTWFENKGFLLTQDGYWFTNGDISITDVWADNCLKDDNGQLRFIDPIIKFER